GDQLPRTEPHADNRPARHLAELVRPQRPQREMLAQRQRTRVVQEQLQREHQHVGDQQVAGDRGEVRHRVISGERAASVTSTTRFHHAGATVRPPSALRAPPPQAGERTSATAKVSTSTTSFPLARGGTPVAAKASTSTDAFPIAREGSSRKS